MISAIDKVALRDVELLALAAFAEIRHKFVQALRSDCAESSLVLTRMLNQEKSESQLKYSGHQACIDKTVTRGFLILINSFG